MKYYFRKLYERTMCEAYGYSIEQISGCLADGGKALDCGAGSEWYFEELKTRGSIEYKQYYGIDWNYKQVKMSIDRGMNVLQGDLNQWLPYKDDQFDCVIGLSVLEHLLNGCRWIKECKRVLKPKGKLIILTPNICTYFTILLLLTGKMPSSGPHPDSSMLYTSEVPLLVAKHMENVIPDVENDTPVHRHLVVFSYRALNKYLKMIGFRNVVGRGFGVYPFPNFLQPILERVDKIHCHQMVFVAEK